MDESLPENTPLQNEAIFLDASHLRCIGFKSLALWVYHPGMRKLLYLATIEVQQESTNNIALFFRLFNEVLSKVSGIPDYKFNPALFMFDHNPANMVAVKEVFGEEIAERKVATCQWHFKCSAMQKACTLEEEKQEQFLEITSQLCQTLMEAHFY